MALVDLTRKEILAVNAVLSQAMQNDDLNKEMKALAKTAYVKLSAKVTDNA